jgi:pyruvate-formate lyase
MIKKGRSIMKLSSDLKRVADEFNVYYANFNPDSKRLLKLVGEMYEKRKSEPSYLLKSSLHELMCHECEVKLFRNSPFFFEISSGRPRYSWGGLQSPVGSFLHNITADRWLNPYADALETDREEGLIHCWNNPVGFDHHCPGYDRLLSVGLRGIMDQAQRELDKCADPAKRDFYTAVLRSAKALVHLAKRFARKAAELADAAESEPERAHFEKIRVAAENVPLNPPKTFYEALCAILFFRECVGSIEGIGFSTLGHLDRMLIPYYEADLAAGRITEEEALKLIHTLFIYTEVRFDAEKSYNETSTTTILGGCDRDGNIIYNEVTKLILKALLEGRYVGTKVNCRISPRHPREYFRKLAEIQTANLPSIVMQNDDVIIAARVKLGQALEDARLYVSGGCHEVVLAGTEVNTRADTWISLPAILLHTLKENGNFDDYQGLYAAFLRNTAAYYEKIVRLKNEGEKHWCEYDPLPLYSSTIAGCLESGRDITEGGAKYSSTAISLLGTATLMDSLYSLKALIFDENRVTLGEFKQILSEDFANHEDLRQYIIRRLPKYGTNEPALNRFSAEILSDIAKIAGQTNARGGKYLPAFYPHDIFRPLGLKLGATPDGRKAHTPLSRGASPSEFIEIDNPADIIRSLGAIDFTDYADSFCAELTLPQMNGERGITVITALMESFLEIKGSSLQFNMLNRERLLEAQKNPAEHADIIVRVCGYSASFVYLSRETQDEIIARAIR